MFVGEVLLEEMYVYLYSWTSVCMFYACKLQEHVCVYVGSGWGRDEYFQNTTDACSAWEPWNWYDWEM